MLRRPFSTTGPDASAAPSTSLFLLLAALVPVAAVVGLAGCFGRVDAGPERFLRACAEECDAALECIAGMCTRSCASANDCSDLEVRAQCHAAPEHAPSGTCDIACANDSACKALGASFMCQAGACREPAGVTTPRMGEPCTPSDEADASSTGFSIGEINIVTDGGCGASNVCLVNHLQGWVTCPAGNDAETESECGTSTGQALSVPLPPQLSKRAPAQAAICSCLCNGPDPTSDYCSCPTGMRCEELIQSGGFLNAAADQIGSYCVY